MTAIKIQCACGQPFSFEVVPVNGRMPASVRCPMCGADGTVAANEFLAKLRPAPPPLPPGDVPPMRQPSAASPAPPSRKKNTVLVITLVAIVVPVMTVASMFSTAATKRYLERSKIPPQTFSTNTPVRVTPTSPARANIHTPAPANETPPPADAEKVEILWGGQWFPGYVVKRDGARTLIHYNGWADSWNEWVTADKLRPGK